MANKKMTLKQPFDVSLNSAKSQEHLDENELRLKAVALADERHSRSTEQHSSPTSKPLQKSSSWPSQHKSLSMSSKMFIALFLCVTGFCYVTLLASIWYDTEMKVSLIVEGYGTMGNIELVQHSFKYLFWFFGIFAFTGGLFLFTSYSEKIKKCFSAAVPLLILLDIGSAWGIRYSDAFAYAMIAAGFLLAVSFLCMFLLIQYDLWLPKGIKGS